jgi:hypothetical protein
MVIAGGITTMKFLVVDIGVCKSISKGIVRIPSVKYSDLISGA